MKTAIYKAVASKAILSPARRRVGRLGATVLLYHDIGDDHQTQDAWQIVRRSDFKAQVAYLRSHYAVVSIDDALAWMRGQLNLPKPPVVITFDDGLIGNHIHLLPLVRELEVPVLIYVATGHVESQGSYWFDQVANALHGNQSQVLDLQAWSLGTFKIDRPTGAARWAQIQAVLGATKSLDPAAQQAVAVEVTKQAGPPSITPPLRPMTIEMLQDLAREPLITLGVHSHGHELLTQLSPEETRATLQTCCDKLVSWTATAPRHMAYPGGFYTQAVSTLMADMGFLTGTTTEQRVWRRQDDLMQIPRFSIGRWDSLDKFKVNIVGGLRHAVRW